MTLRVYRGINAIFDPRSSKWICGDKNSGLLAVIDDDVVTQYDGVTDDGLPVEWAIYTPFVNLETSSIDEIEIESIPGFSGDPSTAYISLTYDGVSFGTEHPIAYSEVGSYTTRFLARRFGYVNGWVGFRLRGTSSTKMTFSTMKVTHS